MNLFAQIRKVDEAKRTVTGRAVQEVVDLAGEILDYEATKPHFRKWSEDVAKDTDGKSLGNVRAMHMPIAAGKVVGIDFQDAEKAIDIECKIVDDQEWKKVLEGVYTGFSIGGKYVEGSRRVEKVNGQDVTRYAAAPSEVSLVDRPCIPTAKFFEIHKADGALVKVDFKAQPAAQEEVVDMTVNGTPDEVDALVKMMAEKGLSMGDLLAGLQKGFPPKDEKDQKDDGDEDMEEEMDADGKPTGKMIPKKSKEEKEACMTAKADVPTLRKNFYECSSFSSVLTSLIALQKSAQYEAFMEGDSSPIAGKIASAIALVGEVFKMAIDEAVAEAATGTEAPAPLVALSQQCGSLTKIANDRPLDATNAEKLAKLQADQADAMAKMVAEAVGPLRKQLDDAQTEIKRLAALPAQPTIRLRAVAKSADLHQDSDKDPDAALKALSAPIIDSSGEKHDAAGFIKALHAAGGRPVNLPTGL